METQKLLERLLSPLIGLIGILSICWIPSAWSDQNDLRLNSLFEQLQTVEDQEAADKITADIWVIWRQSPDTEINELMRSGISAMSGGRFYRAKDIFDEVIEIAPDFAEGWNKRATIHFLLQNYEKSVLDIRQTLMLEPRHFGATAGLGLIFMSLDYPESAVEAFEAALKINPHLPGPRLQIKRLNRFLREDPT